MFYPDQARYAKLAAAELGAEFVDLDDGQGYAFAVRRDGKSFFSGAGLVCSYPINTSSSYSISRDKAHTKSALSLNGIPVISGAHFFLGESFAKLRNPGHEPGDALPYALTLGFPVFCKPLRGARGDFAEIVRSPDELRFYMNRVSRAYDAFLVEPLTYGDEYRVLIQDRRPLFYVRKAQPTVVADGARSVAALLEALNAQLAGTGVSPYAESALAISDYGFSEVPPAGTVIKLAGRRNLSAQGSIDLLELEVPPLLSRISIACCDAIGLRLGAVDLFDTSAEHDLSNLVIIEVNGNPTLRAVEQAGHMSVILGIWKSMISEFLER